MALEQLLDSVILIDHLNSVAAASSYLRDNLGRTAISVITRAEILAGLDFKEISVGLRLLNSFPTLPIDSEVSDLAGRLRREHGWKLPDAFQVAVAQQHQLKFVTRDLHHFPPDRFKFVVVPYSF